MSDILISVVIPLYNAQHTIIESLKSVLIQGIRQIKIIIVDDGSTDNSVDIINNFVQTENIDCIKIIRQENKGVAAARNRAMEYCTGEYIAFLDSDDQWITGKLRNQIEILKNNSEIMLIGGLISDPKKKKNKHIYDISLGRLIFKNYFQPSTVIIRKEIIDKLGGFPEGRRYAEEGDFFYRISAKHRCVILNEKLVVYGDGKRGFGVSGLSGNLKEMEKGELTNIRNAFKRGDISFIIFSMGIFFSVIKYFKRIIFCNIRGTK